MTATTCLRLSLHLAACVFASRIGVEDVTHGSSRRCTIKSTKDELFVSFPLDEDVCPKRCSVVGNWHTDTKETVSGLHAVTVQHFSAVWETKVQGSHCSCIADGTEMVKYRLVEKGMKVSSNSWSANKNSCEKNDDLAKMVCWNWYHKGFVSTLEVDPQNPEALRMQPNSENLRMSKFLADKEDENDFCVPCEGASCNQHNLPPMLGEVSQEVTSLLSKNLDDKSSALPRPIREFVEALPTKTRAEIRLNKCVTEQGINVQCAKDQYPEVPENVIEELLSVAKKNC